jgi:DNA-3-methyladenine glycosylase II
LRKPPGLLAESIAMATINFTLVPSPPFRLELTVWVLRRRADNIIDRWDGRTYRRVVLVKGEPLEVVVGQAGSPERSILQVSVTGEVIEADTDLRVKSALERMLGLKLNLCQFYQLASKDLRLNELAHRFIGVRPPRFETLFEALLNAIVCQQISLTLGIRLLSRVAESYAPSVHERGERFYSFPAPENLAEIDPDDLRAMGLSRQKARAIIELASAVAERRLDLDRVSVMNDEEAIAYLSKIRGVGRWTAEYVLLRGLGRLHVFPGDDVGARRNLEGWLGLPERLDYEGVLRSIAPWGSYAGLVYFHLLLKRLHEAGLIHSTAATAKDTGGQRG